MARLPERAALLCLPPLDAALALHRAASGHMPNLRACLDNGTLVTDCMPPLGDGAFWPSLRDGRVGDESSAALPFWFAATQAGMVCHVRDCPPTYVPRTAQESATLFQESAAAFLADANDPWKLALWRLGPEFVPAPPMHAEADADARAEEAELYACLDACLGEVLAGLGKKTACAIVAPPARPLQRKWPFTVTEILAHTGLLTLRHTPQGKVPDAVHSAVLPAGPGRIQVNPQAAAREAPRRLMERVIDALLDWRCPQSGQRPVTLALTAEDARWLPIAEVATNHIYYAVLPAFAHEQAPALPGRGERAAPLCLFTGRGVGKGARLTRPCRLVDVAPTLCQLACAPVGEHTQGSVLTTLLSDRELQKTTLTARVASMERMRGYMDTMSQFSLPDAAVRFGS